SFQVSEAVAGHCSRAGHIRQGPGGFELYSGHTFASDKRPKVKASNPEAARCSAANFPGLAARPCPEDHQFSPGPRRKPQRLPYWSSRDVAGGGGIAPAAFVPKVDRARI